jgi:Ni,Fe-hydrogenase III small subunit
MMTIISPKYDCKIVPVFLIGKQKEGALEVPVKGSVTKSQKKREKKAEEKTPQELVSFFRI